MLEAMTAMNSESDEGASILSKVLGEDLREEGVNER